MRAGCKQPAPKCPRPPERRPMTPIAEERRLNMRAAELSLFFGRLAIDLDRSSAGMSDVREALHQAASGLGRRELNGFVAAQEPLDVGALAARISESPTVFGAAESRALSKALGQAEPAFVARSAAEHYERLAQIQAAARPAAVVPVLSLCAFVGIVMLFSAFLLPRFAEALAAIGAAKPALTRGVLYGAILFRVVLWPVFLSTALVFLVLALYWRSDEGRRRLSRVLPRVPWLGELYTVSSAARSCTQAILHSQFGMPVSQSPAAEEVAAALASGDAPSALLDESVLLHRRLAHLSRRMIAWSQLLLLLLTLVLCTLIVWATWLPVARLHDSIMG